MTKKPPVDEARSTETPAQVWVGSKALTPLLVPVATLKKDPKNARAHGERSYEAIKTSLARFGQRKPIVVGADGTIVAGNGTLDAALRLGWTHLAVADEGITA